MTRSFRQQGTRALAWTASIPLLLGAVTFWAAGQLRNNIDSVSHTDEVIVALQDILLNITYAESSQRGLLLTGDESFRSKYRQARDQIPGKIANLRRLARDDRTQRVRLDQLAALLESRSTGMQRVLAVTSQGHLPDTYAVDLMRRGGVTMDNIRQACKAMEQEQVGFLGFASVRSAVLKQMSSSALQ